MQEVHRAKLDGVPITFRGIGGHARKMTRRIYETFPGVHWSRDGQTWQATVGPRAITRYELTPSRRD